MRIGTLSRRSNVPVRTIRYYDEIGLLPAVGRTASGYRLFDEHSLALLTFIRRAQRLGLTLEQIGQIIHDADAGERPCNHVRAALISNMDEIDRQIDSLLAIRSAMADSLQRLDRGLDNRNAAICPVIESYSAGTASVPLDSPVDWRV